MTPASGPPGNGNAQAGNLGAAKEIGNRADFNSFTTTTAGLTKAVSSVTNNGALACHNCRSFQPSFPQNPASAFGACRRLVVARGRGQYQADVHRGYWCPSFKAIGGAA